MSWLRRWIKDERAATLVEYALVAALVSLVTIPIVRNMGKSVSNVFSVVNRNLSV
jgi:Flp pilus assembly pilin Flp